MKRHPLQRPVVVLTFLWFTSFFWSACLPERVGFAVWDSLWVLLLVVALPWMLTDGFRRLPARWRDL